MAKAALSKQPCERLIVSPRRQILMEGPLTLLDSSKPSEMYLILFDDLLIVTRKKKALSKKVTIRTVKIRSDSQLHTTLLKFREGKDLHLVSS